MMHNRYMGRPLSTTSKLVLAYLRAHPGARPADVAKALNLNYRTVASGMRRHGKEK